MLQVHLKLKIMCMSGYKNALQEEKDTIINMYSGHTYSEGGQGVGDGVRGGDGGCG